MADRRKSTGAARRGSSGGGRRKAPTKSGPNPAILIGIVALVVVGVVFFLMSTGGQDDGGGGGSEQADSSSGTTPSSGSGDGGGSGGSGSGGGTPSIFDADNVPNTGSPDDDRERVANPKTLVMAKLTDHLDKLYLSEETAKRIAALEAEAKRFLAERWDVSKEMKAEYKVLVEAVSRESNDPFLREVQHTLDLYCGPAFSRTELHLRDENDKLLPAPFKAFAHEPYAYFVQAHKSGGEKEIADKVHSEMVALGEAFQDYFGSFLELKASDKEPVIKVMLFRSMKDYQTYNRLKDPERDRDGAIALAHYEPDKRRLCVPMSGFHGSDPEHTRREVMFHEGTHQLMHFYTDKAHLGAWGAMWSDEGVAEYFGGHSLEPDGSYKFGQINSRIQSVARDGNNRKKRLTMVELLSWTRSDHAREKEENLQKATDIHLHVYSQGWALVRFLDANYKKQFEEIMRRQIVKGDAGLPVFRTVFGDDFERIEEEFQVYQDKLTDDYRAKKLKNGQLVD